MEAVVGSLLFVGVGAKVGFVCSDQQLPFLGVLCSYYSSVLVGYLNFV